MIRLAKQLTLSWVANAIVLAVVTVVLSGVKSDTVGDLIRAALLFGILNTILKPLLRLLTLPLAFITLGLIWFGVAMVMLWLTSIFIDGFSIHGFWTYVWATVIVWVVTSIVAYHCLTRVTSLLVLGFTARESIGPASVVPLARQGIGVLLAGAAIALGAAAPTALAALPFAALLVLIGMYVFAARRLGTPQLRFRRAEIAWYLREGNPYFSVVLLSTLYGRLGIIVLAALSGEAAAGVFAAAERLVVAIGTIQVMFFMALLPVVTQLWKNDRDRFAELSQRAARANLLVTLPIATLLALFAHDIVHLLYARQFADAVPVLVGIAWILVVRGISQLLTSIATATDHQRILARSKSFGLVVLVVVSLALMPRYGALGLVAASLASEISAVVLNYVMLRGQGIPTTTFPGGLRVALACLLAAALDWLLSDLAFGLRLPIVAVSGMAALWLFGAVRAHDLTYLRAILAARESSERPAGGA